MEYQLVDIADLLAVSMILFCTASMLAEERPKAPVLNVEMTFAKNIFAVIPESRKAIVAYRMLKSCRSRVDFSEPLPTDKHLVLSDSLATFALEHEV